MRDHFTHTTSVLGAQYGGSSAWIRTPGHDAVEVVGDIYQSQALKGETFGETFAKINIPKKMPPISGVMWIAIIAGILVLLPAIHWLRNSEARVEYPEDDPS